MSKRARKSAKPATGDALLEALARGREDIEFFWRVFLKRTPHPGQLEFATNATATLNCLATANRWGKTVLLPGMHYHAQVYKTGAEPRYLREDGAVDPERFVKTKYRTVHTADEWELAALVWDEARKILNESPELQALVKDAPASKPPHIDFLFGGRWKFRTLGRNASGIDGDSYYLVTIDEAGWIERLGEMMQNVIRVRVSDVRGVIVIVGTFKPGVSRDFYKLCVQASAHTGAALGFDYRDDAETELVTGGLPAAIERYLAEAGINLGEYADAVTRDAERP